MVAVLGVLAVLVLGWLAWTDHVLDRVSVRWAGEPVCTGTELQLTTVHADDPRDPLAAPEVVVPARPGMRCYVIAEVHNDSRSTVRLEEYAAEGLGPEMGTIVRAVTDDGSVARPSDDGNDMVYPASEDLAGGTHVQLRLGVELRPDACYEPGLNVRQGLPTVTISMLGRARSLRPTEQLKVLVLKDSSRC